MPDFNGLDRCSRWEECQHRDEENLRMIERAIDQMREDHKEMWAAINATNKTVSDLAVTMGTMTGKFVGYLASGTLVVGILVFVASQVLHH